MSDNTLSVKIKQRCDTESNWSSNNPVLLAGEIAISSDKKLFKTGDGTSRWSALAYNNANSANSATSAANLSTARAIDGVNFNGTSAITHYGTCSTAAATVAKTVSLNNFTLVKGARVAVKFTVTNTASSPTLNVNSTGAKPIYYRGSAISAGYLAANRTYEFVYDGTQYDLIGDLDTNTTYSAATTSYNGLLSYSSNVATISEIQTYIGY